MTRFNNKKKAAIMLTGTLALTGAISAIPMPMFQNGMAAVVYAADGTEYSTVKGIATMGTGQAHIDIAGNEGQTLVGKKFNVYKLFEAENAKGGESINYTFNPTYEQALKNVVAKAKKAGVVMTPAGAPFPYGKDPKDSVIRIAPSYPSLEDLTTAAEIFVVCVKLASIEKILEEK